MEKLTASLPRAKTGVEERSERACDEGRRTAKRCKVRRGQAQHRRHEKEKEKAWGLRKADAKLGKELTWAKMRRSGGFLSGWISAMFFLGENLCDRLWGWSRGFRRGRGHYLRGSRLAGQASRGNRAAGARSRADSGSVTR